MDATTAPPAPREEPRFMRSAIIGAVLGFVATTIGVAAVGTAGGLHLVAALGLGAFAGIWSGVGFGFMMGATIPLGRHIDH